VVALVGLWFLERLFLEPRELLLLLPLAWLPWALPGTALVAAVGPAGGRQLDHGRIAADAGVVGAASAVGGGGSVPRP
jgi:hypothetical protein